MSISSLRSSIASVRRAIADLEKSDAQEAKREADYVAKAASASSAIGRTKDASTVASRMKDHERAVKDAAGIRSKRADLSGKIADKQKEITRYQDQLSREEEVERKKQEDAQKRLQREQDTRDRKAKDDFEKMAREQRRLQQEREQHERRVSAEIASRTAPDITDDGTSEMTQVVQKQYDFFISHAWEDKETFVAKLAEELKIRGAEVWYDSFTMKIGDSLRRKIDEGLKSSRYGVVVLSDHFFKKDWPQRELDGLFALETGGQKKVLPIWHKVSKDDVASYSPVLADRVALQTSLKTSAEIAQELMKLLE